MGGPPGRSGGGGGFGGPPRSMNGGGNFSRASPWATMNGESSLMNQQPAPMLSPTGGPGAGGPGGVGKGSTQVTIPKDVSNKNGFYILILVL